jgi:hypothetical protein
MTVTRALWTSRRITRPALAIEHPSGGTGWQLCPQRLVKSTTSYGAIAAYRPYPPHLRCAIRASHAAARWTSWQRVACRPCGPPGMPNPVINTKLSCKQTNCAANVQHTTEPALDGRRTSRQHIRCSVHRRHTEGLVFPMHAATRRLQHATCDTHAVCTVQHTRTRCNRYNRCNTADTRPTCTMRSSRRHEKRSRCASDPTSTASCSAARASQERTQTNKETITQTSAVRSAHVVEAIESQVHRQLLHHLDRVEVHILHRHLQQASTADAALRRRWRKRHSTARDAPKTTSSTLDSAGYEGG